MIRIPDRVKGWHPYLPVKNIIVICVLGGVVASTIFASSHALLAKQLQFLSANITAKTIASNGSAQWANDATITTPVSTFSLVPNKQITISPLFLRYYQSHAGTGDLGAPITDAFPIDQGWLQFFASGALFSRAKPLINSQNSYDTLTSLIDQGSKDVTTGIIRLPLLQALLTSGSQVPIDNLNSSFTYVNLRKATAPALMQSAPTKKPNGSSSLSNSQAYFVKGGTRAGKDVGHFIPQALWDYINRADVSPDGWVQDFGAPVTEAVSFTLTANGKTYHIVVQAFARDGVLLDLDVKDALGHPFIQRLATGVDYLSTFGLPAVATQAQQAAWTIGNTALLANPISRLPIAHVGQSFALKLAGTTQWIGGMLWYRAQWSTPKTTSSGWVSANDITFTSPGNVPQWATIDTLSPRLATYLNKIGSDAGVVVYDITHQRYYTYNSNTQFIVASSMKVPIMFTFFDRLEQQGLEPDDGQMNVLTTMIENSDNDSASELYFNELNGATSITNYMKKIGINGINPDPGAWGYSTISPQAMVNLLTLFYEGKILTSQDRATAYNLMENIESDEQVGVGDTAPNGSTVAMKDGWVTGPDDLWAMNTSGIVMSGKETYIISVYTQEQPSLDNGQAIVREVCSSVASLLT